MRSSEERRATLDAEQDMMSLNDAVITEEHKNNDLAVLL